MKNRYSIEKSALYKRNLKIHKNLWKPYTIALLAGILLIAIKGLS